MTRGKPDYRGSNTDYGQEMTDVAELAARLGSPVNLDRRGSVIMIERWAGLLAGWYVLKTGNVSAMISPTNVYNSDRALAIDVGVTTGHNVYLAKRSSMINQSKHGLEVCVNMPKPGGDPTPDLVLGLAHYNGSQRKQFQVYISQNNNKAFYYTDLGTPQSWIAFIDPLPNAFQITPSVQFQMFKMVVDLQLGQYNKLLWNDKNYSMVGLTPSVAVSTVAANLEITLKVQNVGFSGWAYISHLIVTMDEP